MNNRPLYRHSDLRKVLAPRSIAVVGASPRAGSFGLIALLNLESFPGAVYAVNEKYQEVAGRACYPTVSALPEVPDCVIVTVGRTVAERVVRECSSLGVGGLVLFASGYAETGLPERRTEQETLAKIAQEGGVRLIGPNCIGILNYSANLAISFTGGLDVTDSGRRAVGIASQSGAMGNAVAQATHMGLPFSHMLTAGNSCDVDTADYVSYLAEDDACHVIVCLFEGLSSPDRLLEAAEIAHRRNKPLIVCKIATSAAGAGSALSHTGVLAGSNAVYDAAFRRMNAVVVENLEDVAETAAFFLKAPRARAGTIAVLAASGGFCTIGADKSEKYGVELAAPSPRIRGLLEKLIPEFGRVGNPCDMTAQNTADSIRACCDAMLSGDEYDSLVLPYTYAFEQVSPRITNLDSVAKQYGKIACLPWTTAWVDGPGAKEVQACENVAVFRSMDNCFCVLAAWQARETRNRETQKAVEEKRLKIEANDVQAVGRLLVAADRTAMGERDSKTVLRHYGIPVVRERLVGSADGAVAAAREFGMPVVLKIEADDLVHKTEAGAVLLNLANAEEVRAAYATLLKIVDKNNLHPSFRGVLVQPMINRGLEILAGVRIDPQFGAVVMVGMGGTLVELLQDSVIDLAPLKPSHARAMLQRLKGKRLLDGFRGAAAVNRSALAEVLCRLSELAFDHSGLIREIDINPLICDGDTIVAVDALIIRK